MRIKKAIFPVAGLGTRFLPATKVVPKELLPLLDKPLIQYALEEAINAGIEEFLFITSRGKGLVEDHFDATIELENSLLAKNKLKQFKAINDKMPKDGSLFYMRQKQALGLGHAIYLAKNFINNQPFVVILPDEVFLEEEGKSHLKDMIDIFDQQQNQAVVMATMEVERSKVTGYGIFDVKTKNGNLIEAKGIIEKPSLEEAPSNYANIGRYLLPPEILNYLKNATPTKDNEIQLTDAIDRLLKEKKLFACIFNGKRHDCGNPLGMFEAWVDKATSHEDFGAQAKAILKKYL